MTVKQTPFDYVLRLPEEKAFETAVIAISSGSPELLANLAGRFSLEAHHTVLLNSALMSGKAPCVYVLLESGCSDEVKESALKSFNEARLNRIPGAYTAGHAMAAALIDDSLFNQAFAVRGETTAGIMTFIQKDPRLKGETDAIFSDAVKNKLDQGTSLFSRPAVAGLGKLIGFGAFVESKAAEDHMRKNYPTYAAIAARVEPFWFTMQPMHASALNQGLARDKFSPSRIAPAG